MQFDGFLARKREWGRAKSVRVMFAMLGPVRALQLGHSYVIQALLNRYVKIRVIEKKA